MSALNNNEYNIVIKNEHWNQELESALFQLTPHEGVVYLQPDADIDMHDILVLYEVFPSRGQAKKNWAKTGSKIPDGFNDFPGIGKHRIRITTWIPIG